jgi:hypothetical protein
MKMRPGSTGPGRIFFARSGGASPEDARPAKPVSAAQVAAPGPPARVGRTALRAAVRVVPAQPDTLRVEATVTNEGEVAREVAYGTCGQVLLVPAGGDPGRPSWSSGRRTGPGGAPLACGGQVLTLELPPGASSEPGRIAWRYAVPEVLGDSLRAGRYRVALELELDGERIRADAGEVDLAPRP